MHGIELDADAFELGAQSARAWGVPRVNLERRDFFAVQASERFEAVIGNPPYIRFQRLGVATRQQALARAKSAGVELSPLASSWAPFLVHSTASLARGGRLAMLVPHEIGQARYAREIVAFLARSFEKVTFVAFTPRLFPHLDQETLAVLASGRGGSDGTVGFARAAELDQLLDAESGAVQIDVEDLTTGRRTLRFFELPTEVRDLYACCERHSEISRLGEVAAVTSGYVTGANAFFHLSPERAAEHGLPAASRTPAVFRSRALRGLDLVDDDWEAATRAGHAGFLLTPGAEPDPATLAYLRMGEATGVDRGYKTRTRTPWYAVPRVRRPDLLMAAMAADTHGLSVNRVGVAAANTLHGVELIPRSGAAVPALVLALAWLTSISRLSRELEGRVLGGGMLKIEPGEAGRILVPAVRTVSEADARAVATRVDAQLRAGQLGAAQGEADRFLLAGVVGLSPQQIEKLAAAARTLRALRKRYKNREA